MKRSLRILVCLLLCLVLLPRWTPPARAAFRDVPASGWATDAINRAVATGLIQGRTADTFGMGAPMTRGAFVTVLCRFFGWKAVTPAAPTFADTGADVWCFSSVETAVANGALTRQSSSFRPGDPITREEMAVMLVRALGYTTIAGLEQGLPCPFTDVTTNRGYLTMAYHLGISNGVTADTFAPTRTATREQAVVMLMRIYDRYLRKTPLIGGLLSRDAAVPAAVSVTAVPAVQLVGGDTPAADRMDPAQAAALRDAAHAADAKALLHVIGFEYALTGDMTAAAAAIAKRAVDGGYDGVLLDVPDLPALRGDAYTALVTALRAALPDGLLWVTADAPVPGKDTTAYRYAALAAQVDRLVLRIDTDARMAGNFPTDPPQPLENIYYALAVLKSSVPGEKLALTLSSTGSAWQNTGSLGSMDGAAIAALMARPDTAAEYSARYATACLVQTQYGSHTVVWYNDAVSAAAKAQLCALFGVSSFFINDLSGLAVAEWSPVNGLLP